MVKVFFKNSTSHKIPEQKVLETAKTHLKNRGVVNASIEVEIVGKSKMQKLNLKFMKKNCPTDVLSFPLPKISPKDNLLGTIFLCRDIIENNSTKEGVSFESEFDKNLKHGIDHLVGIHHD